LAERVLGRAERVEAARLLKEGSLPVRVPAGGGRLAAWYQGEAASAALWLPCGMYEATGRDGSGEARLVVGRSPLGDDRIVSGAFRLDRDTADRLAGVPALRERAVRDGGRPGDGRPAGSAVRGGGQPAPAGAFGQRRGRPAGPGLGA
jgi:hypothetical protein